MKQQEIQQRRNKIVNAIKYKENLEQGLEEAQSVLLRYLKERGMNSTPERSYILSVIYHIDGPFDVDSLHQLVCEKKGYLCRVTIYNSLMLFVEAGVVARFQPFPTGTLFFEKCIGQKPHGYQVCRKCGAIRVLDMSEVMGPITEQLPNSFHPAQYCLYVVGLCANCHKEERHEVRLKQIAKKQELEKKKNERSRAKKRYRSIKEVRLDQELAALKEKKNK